MMSFYRPRFIRRGGDPSPAAWAVRYGVAVFVVGVMIGFGFGYIACVLQLPGFQHGEIPRAKKLGVYLPSRRVGHHGEPVRRPG